MKTVENALSTALRRLMISTVVVYLALAGLGTFGWLISTEQRNDIREVATSTNTALCALRGDLEQRIANAEQFLKDNPDGIPGLSAEAIQTSIDGQQRTVDALGILQCGGGE